MWARFKSAPAWMRQVLWQLPLLAIVLFVGSKVQESFDESLDRFVPETVIFTSTHNHKPSGYSAFWELMQKAGLTCSRWESPYRDLKQASGTVLLVSPSHALRDFEVDQLLTWVESGNKLIYLDGFMYGAGEHLLQKLGASGIYARTVDDDIKFKNLPKEDTSAHVKSLVFSSDTRIRGGKSIASDDRGAFLTQFTKGKGKIILGTFPDICANRRISKSEQWGNFQYLLNLVRAGGGQIFVDEKVHGFSSSHSLLKRVLQTPIGPFSYQIAFIVLVALLSLNQRFGRVILPSEKRKIASSEFIDGMARTYEKAKAHEAAFQILYQSFRQRLCRALSLTPDQSADEIATVWAASAPVSKEEALKFLKQADGLISKNKLTGPELLETMQECDRLCQLSKATLSLHLRRLGG